MSHEVTRGLRRFVALGMVLGITVLVVPDSALRSSSAVLVKVETARAVEHDRDVLWILALGSDARPGQDLLRSRADAIQLVGVNLETGSAVGIGIPRDSWVTIPGHGSNKINAAMAYGGPKLMADAVAGLVGVTPDYVFTAGFGGFRSIVDDLGGVTVQSPYGYFDREFSITVKRGRNTFRGGQALSFARLRYPLPRGDFDRSANQQALLKGLLRQARAREDRPGFMERGALSALLNLNTNLSPTELYRMAQAATNIDPGRFTTCVLDGDIGTVGGASVVLPDTDQARRLGREAKDDARLEHGC